MFLIAGLGNPETEYGNTRHNVGFDAINRLADKYHINVETRKYKTLYGKGIIAGQKVILAKPQTFMNASGESIHYFVDYFKLDPETQLLVLSDDVSLDVGQLRIRKKGSAGGHNGLKNIIAHLNTLDFPRIKIGVGKKPAQMNLADYVLGHFSAEDREKIDASMDEVVEAIELILAGEMDQAMNRFNTRKKPVDEEGGEK